jgi:hypothetical protein
VPWFLFRKKNRTGLDTFACIFLSTLSDMDELDNFQFNSASPRLWIVRA